MLDVVTSANVACGGHAGDPNIMYQTLCLARDRGVLVGAHPGFADREGFGRRVIPCTPAEIERLVAAQVGTLIGVAALVGVAVAYVKPHGALGNLAADNRSVAEAIVRAAAAFSPPLAILAISGTELESVAAHSGLRVYSEVFADRGYLESGRLVPRNRPGAMIDDGYRAATRLMEFLDTGLMPTVEGPSIALRAHSICVHGDTAGAVIMAQTVRKALMSRGIRLQSFLDPCR
jgi:UPF0271 protein